MKKKPLLPEVEEVRLPTIFNMRPGKYLLILLILLLVLSFFLLCVLPGLLNRGQYIHFNINYSQVGVLVDDIYKTSSEGSFVFIDDGKHNVKLIKDSKLIDEFEIDIKGRVLFSLFNKSARNIEHNISPNKEIYERALSTTFDEINLYSAVTDYSDQYHYKPLFQLLAKDAISANIKDVRDDFYLLSLFITSNEMKDDFDLALKLLDNYNISYKSDKLDKLYSSLDEILSGNGSLVLKTNDDITVSSKYIDGFHYYDKASIEIGEDSYFNIEQANTLPIVVDIEPFCVSRGYVTESDYYYFVKDNPKWDKVNIDALIDENLVDEYYLAGIYLTKDSIKPIRNISYHAALAYIDYINKKYNENYRLPTEAEYELMSIDASDKSYSTSLFTIDNDYSSPKDVNGGLWELTQTSYIPLSRLSDDYQEITSLDIGDVVIKGGSYINNSSSVDRSSVGIIRKEVCSEYVGFRLARDL